MIMNGQMKKYKKFLEGMSDLRVLMQYAKNKGVKVSQLTKSERLQHSHVKSRISL